MLIIFPYIRFYIINTYYIVGTKYCFPSLFLIESESEVAQSFLILCDPMDYSLPGSTVHGTVIFLISDI